MKRTSKRIAMLALALMFVVGLMVPQAWAGSIDSGTCGKGVKWSLSSDGTLTVSGEGKMKGYYRGEPTPWNKHAKKIKKVKIKKGVTRVGGYNFFECTKLESVSLPSTVYKIDTCAFYECTKLKKISFSNGLKSIDEAAFDGCKRLTEIKLPKSVKKIGYGAFKDCKRLKKVKLNDGLKTIGGSAFIGCPKLKSIFIPKSVKNIHEDAFGFRYWYDEDSVDEYWDSHIDDFVIIGYPGTAAEQYSIDYTFDFREK